jgi:hypothetical protein
MGMVYWETVGGKGWCLGLESGALGVEVMTREISVQRKAD